MRLFGSSLVVAILACGGAVAADAAEIRFGPGVDPQDRRTSDELVIEGKIEAGDCRKLMDTFSREGAAGRIYLVSPGGDVAEAMELGRLVRALKLWTIIPSKFPSDLRARVATRYNLRQPEANFMCTSACFFVFVGGVHRIQQGVSTSPMLGIHRPYLSENDLKAISSDEAIRTANQTRAKVEAYLKQMGVPAKYADRMFATPKDRVQWISEEEFHADLEGTIPELREWIDAKGKAILEEINEAKQKSMRTDHKAFYDNYAKIMSDPVRRELEMLGELSNDGWMQMFGKLSVAERTRSFCTRQN